MRRREAARLAELAEKERAHIEKML